jgi:hypothetical protein
MYLDVLNELKMMKKEETEKIGSRYTRVSFLKKTTAQAFKRSSALLDRFNTLERLNAEDPQTITEEDHKTTSILGSIEKLKHKDTLEDVQVDNTKQIEGISNQNLDILKNIQNSTSIHPIRKKTSMFKSFGGNKNIIKHVNKGEPKLKNNLKLLVKGLFKMISTNNDASIEPAREPITSLLSSLGITSPNDSKEENKENKEKDVIRLNTSSASDDVNNSNNKDKKEKDKDVTPEKTDSNSKRENIFKKLLKRKKDKNSKNIEAKKPMVVINDPLIGENENISDELKLLRREYALYKNVVENISNEDTSFKRFRNEFYTLLTSFQNNQRALYKIELENLNRILKIYKYFNEQELSNNRNIIEELAKTIDDILLK